MASPTSRQRAAQAPVVRFVHGEKHEMLRESAQKFLEAKLPTTRVRELMETAGAHDPEVWKEMAALGWHGLLVPEELGGVGLDLFDLGVILEEMGGAVMPGPYLAAQLATLVLLEGASEKQKAAWLPGVCDGTTIPTLALFEKDRGWEPTGEAVQASAAPRGAGGHLLSGAKLYVMDAMNATHFVVSAATASGPALFWVDAAAPGIEVIPDKLADETRRSATVRLRRVQVPAEARIGGARKANTILAAALPRICCALAAELVGTARKVFQISVHYARIREQFGRPIGSFQGIKHRLVDRMVEVENARSLVYGALYAQDHEPARAERLARMAKAYLSDVGPRIADTAVRTHGGIGFTWESDVHLYWKRLHWGQMAFGDGTHHRRWIAADLERSLKPIGGPTPTGI